MASLKGLPSSRLSGDFECLETCKSETMTDSGGLTVRLKEVRIINAISLKPGPNTWSCWRDLKGFIDASGVHQIIISYKKI